jgi:hypothetical protein
VATTGCEPPLAAGGGGAVDGAGSGAGGEAVGFAAGVGTADFGERYGSGLGWAAPWLGSATRTTSDPPSTATMPMRKGSETAGSQAVPHR